MKRLIKKLLKEGLNQVTGFNDITPEERQEIDARFHSYIKQENDNQIKNQKRLADIYSNIEHIKNHPDLEQHIKDTILDEQYDANDADIFLQLCVMGEVVFG